MKRWKQLFVRLYPKQWRERYGEEFRVLLEETPSGLWVLLDILKGAFLMQFHSLITVGKTTSTFAMIGMIAALVVSIWIPSWYIADGALRTTAEDREINSTIQSTLNRATTITLVDKYDLYAAQRGKLPLEDFVEMVRKNVNVSAQQRVGDAAVIRVTFQDHDPSKAQAITGDLIRLLSTANPNLIASDMPGLPLDPAGPNRKVIAFLGLFAGTFFGICVHWLRIRKPASL